MTPDETSARSPGTRSALRSALAYYRGGGISLGQSFLKHSLVPLSLLIDHLPDAGTILDLGCGEGILANRLARALPHCRVLGYDLDEQRVELAARNAPPNARFEVRDVFDLPQGLIADGAILNDVVHHVPFRRQRELLAGVLRQLRPGAALVHKEVDRLDGVDFALTRFFDSRLYPEDSLSFRSLDDWLALWKRLGVRDVRVQVQRHFWPASRTLLVFRRPEDARLRLNPAPPPETLRSPPDVTTVLLTGGTGFIGAHLARRLMAGGLGGRKVRLLMLVRDEDRVPEDLAASDAVPILGDLDELPAMSAALDDVDYVFHLAAEVRLRGGVDLWRNNRDGTRDLLDAMRPHGIRRLIHASTMGAVDRAPDDPCTSPLDESVLPHPLSEYGRSKLEAEQAVAASGLPYTILRIPWGYGPGMTPDTHVRFLTQKVCNHSPLSWLGFPGRVSLVAVDDLVDAFVLAAERDEARGETYYVSDGRPVSLGALFRQTANLIGRRGGFIRIPRPVSRLAKRWRRFFPLSIQNLNSDVLTVNNSKIATLGHRPRVALRQGLERLLQDLGAARRAPGSLVTVVTGAASGIGQALARELHAEGHALLLVDSDVEGLRAIAAELSADSLALDLADPGAPEALEEKLDTGSYRLDWLVNNAGTGAAGASADLPPGRQERIVDVNCRVLTSLSRIALRHFGERGSGTLINVASSSGFQPLPFMAAYAASKAYVQSYSRALRAELGDSPGVLVVTVNPSGTQTTFQAKAGVREEDGESLLKPEHVARTIVAAAYARKNEVTIGWSGKLMSLAARVLPRSAEVRLWGRLMGRLRLPRDP